MWDIKRKYLNLWKFNIDIFGFEARDIQTRCTWFYRFKVFQTVFSKEDLVLLSALMFNINKIDYTTKKVQKSIFLYS